MSDFSSNDPVGPIQGPPKGGEEETNPFIQGPHSFTGKDSTTKRENFVRRETKKEEGQESDKSIFGGDYGTARTKKIYFMVGRKGGYADFKSERNRVVRQKMVDLRKEFFSPKNTFVKRQPLSLKMSVFKRDKMPYLKGYEKEAATKFFKEVKEKTGLE